ncbi:hypothetical protein Dimus_023707 [Dionaea muscipula]
MELPFSRHQGTCFDQVRVHDSSRFHPQFSNSKSSFSSSGDLYLINKGKLRTPFSQIIKCCKLDETLRPKPKPKLPLETQIRKLRSGLCEQIENLVFYKRYREALELFEILESGGDCGAIANSSTYDALVSACIGLRSVRGVKKVLDHILSSGFELDPYMWNRVLLMHVRCGMMVDARQLFDDMPERNLVSWNTIISGLVDSGDFGEAFHLFLTTWMSTLEANSRTFATMIRASAGLGLIDQGAQLHSCVVKMGFADDVFISCALIDMYSKCGSIADAQFVFDKMPKKTTVGWNTIIAGYALHGYSEEALSMYYKMQDSGVKMDHFTFSIVVRICARLGSLDHAKQAHAAVVRRGCTLDIVANTSLVDLYSKWGKIEEARIVFDRMPSKNVISWNALIAGYGNHGRGSEAIQLFDQMVDEGMMRPNHVTFLAVLSACSYSGGLLDQGRRFFELMGSREFIHIKPRAMHYACMIELLGREGLLDEALGLIRDAPFEPTLNMWAALLTACRVHNNFELGKFAAEKLHGMEPVKLSNYVVLLNIYKSCGKDLEAASVLQTLKDRGGLRTVPRACTWIEVKKHSHVFVSGDKHHSQTKEIYRRLRSSILQVSKLGYSQNSDSHDLLSDVDEKEDGMVLYHSEKLALAFGLIKSTPQLTSLQLMQSHRICRDCHTFFKLVAKVTGKEIVLRDGSRFHRFKDGTCTCGDYW